MDHISTSATTLSARAASLVVVAGGVRSGKSRFALELALRQGPRRYFVATARAFDDEMQRRIARHREERAGAFTTVEAPLRLEAAAQMLPEVDVVLLDCLTLYLSNLLLEFGDVDGAPEAEIADWEDRARADVLSGVHQLRQKAKQVIVVTNEVGMGIVPASRLGRIFRDVAGKVNQWVAAQADQVWLCALGLPLCLKPSSSASPLGGTPPGVSR